MKKSEQKLIEKIDSKLESDINFDDLSAKITFEPKKTKVVSNPIFKLAIVVGSCAVVCAIVIPISLSSGTGKMPTDYKGSYLTPTNVPLDNGTKWTSEESGLSGDVGVISSWNQRPTKQKYDHLVYNEVQYLVSSTNSPFLTDASLIGSKLDTITVEGFDENEKVFHEEKADVFTINKVNPKIGIAIKLEGSNEYVPYIYDQFEFNTVDELALGINIKDYAAYRYTYLPSMPETDIVNSDSEYDMIYQAFFENNTETIVNDTDYLGNVLMKISIDVEPLGIENMTIAYYDNGYASTNLLNSFLIFKANETKAQEFLSLKTLTNEGKN